MSDPRFEVGVQNVQGVCVGCGSEFEARYQCTLDGRRHFSAGQCRACYQNIHFARRTKMDKKRYVVGIPISESRVLLVQKPKGTMHEGQWNGAGGKVLDGEDPLHAMRREGVEELGAIGMELKWEKYATVVGDDYEIHFFKCVVLENDSYPTEPGELQTAWFVEEQWMLEGQEELVHDLRFMIALAMSDSGPVTIVRSSTDTATCLHPEHLQRSLQNEETLCGGCDQVVSLGLKAGQVEFDPVQWPRHYVADSGLEVRQVIADFGLTYNEGTVVAYVVRSRHKGTPVEDLRKAIRHLQFEIEAREK